MDKKQQPREVRRGHNNNNNNNNKKLFSCVGGGDLVFSGKSKKERLRKLSGVGKVSSSSLIDCEMGCDVSSDKQDELPTKRFKLPKKLFNDYNGVDHARVPRKLRSAMRKRIRESVSSSLPSSKKLNHTMSSGTESRKRINMIINPKEYLKQGGSDRSPRETVCGDMTKDEEEVAETLYYLAGLIPNNDANDNSKLNTKPSASLQSKESLTPALEDGNDKSDSICPLRAIESASQSNVERLTKEADQVDSLNKTSTQHEAELPNCRKLSVNSDSSVPLNLNVSSLSPKVEQRNEKPSVNAVNFGPPSDLNLDSWLNQLVQKESSLCFRIKPETPLQLGTNIGTQGALHDIVHESTKKGPVLWPGLFSNVFHGARNDSPSSKSPPAKIPAWLDAALSTSRALVRNGSFKKVTKVVNGRRSCKQCAAHVYISYLIQGLQNSESKDKLHPQPNPTRTHEGSKQGAVPGVNIYVNVKNDPNGIVSASSTGISAAQEYVNEAKNRTLQLEKLHQDQSQSTMESRAYTWPKQSFDFLSLSAGSCGLETNDSFSRARNGMEQLSQSRAPYTHSLMQHHTLDPFSLPQSHYSSSACTNNSSVPQQAQLQMHPYHGNPFGGPQASPAALTSQQSQQQHLQLLQQQQRLWAAHFAAQYRPAGTAASAVHYANWQNARHETTLIPCGQALMSPSDSTLELVGPKYAALSSRQQQHLMAVTSSLPPGRVKLQDHHLPSVYESGGGFRAQSALPLQLLCNERLK